MDALPHRARFHRALRTVPAGALSLALLTCAAMPAAAQTPVQPAIPSGQAEMTATAGLISQIVGGQSAAGASDAGSPNAGSNSSTTAPNAGKGVGGATVAQAAAAVPQEEAFSYTVSADGKGATIIGYSGTDATLQVPATLGGAAVTAVGVGAFQNNGRLTAVTLPPSVQSVGDYAFANCPKLASVTLNEGLAYLGAGAFQNDAALTEVSLPSTLTGCGMAWSGTAGIGPFGGCTALARIELAPGTAAVPAYLLTGCTNEQVELALPDSVASVADTALEGPKTVVIVANPGTFAQAYASEHGLPYVDPNVHATSVSLNANSLRLKTGAKNTLLAAIAPEGVTDPVTWSSSDPAVAQVSDAGVVSALKAGTATVTVSVSGLSAGCEVTVWQPVTSIALNRSAFQMEAAETRQLTAACSPEDATDKRVTWSSSNPKVATVNAQTGLVTAVAEGSATITATAVDGAGAKKSCTVTVTSNAYAVTDIAQLQSPHPYADNCDDAWVYTLPGAKVIDVTFDPRTEAEYTFDTIEVYDGTGALLGAYTGTELAGTTLTVGGDTVKVKLDTDEVVNGWGFAVTAVTAVNPDGWVVIDGITYYYVDGAPYKGEILLADGWHYFNPNTGAMVTGLVRLPDGRTVYYDARGVMQTGNVLLPDGWHYFDPETGNMVTGLFCRPDGTVVYYNPNGTMRVGDVYINDVLYQFDMNTGVLINEQTVINQIVENNTTINNTTINNENNTTINNITQVVVNGATADDDPEPDPVPEVPEGPKDEGEKPSEPEKPTEPERPAEPEQPSEPETSTEPEKPAEPEQPAEPETPTESEEPTEPEKPAEPEPPTEPEQPLEPEQPTEPEKPAEPETPTEPEKPTGPDAPAGPEQPAEPGQQKPDETVTPDSWEVSVDTNGVVTTDLLTFTLPQEWRSNVTVSTGDSSGVPTLLVCPTEQSDFPLVSFTVERADAPLIDGDVATYRAASWSNGNGQRIDMWCCNPAMLLWSSQNTGTQDPFTTSQAVEQAIYLGSGGRFTPGAVVDAPSDVDAATMGAYGQLSIEPTVLVPFYRDGNQEGTAGPEAGVTWSDDVRALYDLAPETPDTPEEPASEEPPAAEQQPDGPETPSEPEQPAEPTEPAEPTPEPEQPTEAEAVPEPETPAEPEAEPTPEQQPAEPAQSVEPKPEPDQPAEPTPEPETAAEPEVAAEPEQPVEPVSLLLDYSVAEDYQAVNELLNVFAQAYPGTSYNDETPITDPAAAQKQVEDLVMFGIDHVLLVEGTQTAEQFSSDANPLGWGDFTAAMPAKPAFDAVAIYCGVEIDPLSNLGEHLYSDGETLYFVMPANPRTQNGVMAATAFTQVREGTYEVTFSEYGGSLDQAVMVPDAKDASLHALAPADLQARLGAQGPTVRQGKATVEVVDPGDGTGRQLKLRSFELVDPTPVEPEPAPETGEAPAVPTAGEVPAPDAPATEATPEPPAETDGETAAPDAAPEGEAPAPEAAAEAASA